MAMEFIIIVVMTSLTFFFTFSTPGIQAYRAPAAMAPKAATGMTIQGDKPFRTTPM